jgi:hypothetical protein
MGTKKTTKKAAKTTAKKMARKPKAKVAQGTKAGSSQAGKELQALQRLDPLTKQYQAAGLSPEEARKRALDELRTKPRRDRRPM